MADPKLDSKIPEGPLKEKWSRRKSSIRVVSPNNKRKLEEYEEAQKSQVSLQN